MKQPKIAAYLDEAGADPVSAARNLLSHEIRHVALRYLRKGATIIASDSQCQKLLETLNSFGIRTILITTDIGKVSNGLTSQETNLHRVISVAKYFGATYLRVYAGCGGKHKQTAEWLNMVCNHCSGLVIPVIEPATDCYPFEPGDIMEILVQHPQLRIIYDPAQLVQKRKLDPFTKYWPLLKKYAAAIDIHDFYTGRGHVLPGQGHTHLPETLKDASNTGFDGWYILEPNLGHKYGKATTKANTFAVAYEALRHLVMDKT